MATRYPTAFDNFVNPTGVTDLDTSAFWTHAQQHSDLNDAVEAIQLRLGINGVVGEPEKVRHAAEHAAMGVERNPGGGPWTRRQLMPVHHCVMDPDTLTGLPLTSGSITLSYDSSEKERSSGSLKISVATNVTAAASPRLPLPAANVFGTYPKLNSRVHLRVKCSDWSKVTRLYANFAEGGGTTKYHLSVIANAGDGFQGMHSGFDAKWSGAYRTLIISADKSIPQGSPASWCEYNVPESQYVTDGLFFSLTTTGAVDLWIDRIYSPRWPVGYVCLIGDGAYESFRNIAIPEFDTRGWRLGVSLYRGTGVSPYPAAQDIKSIADRGHDVFPHMHHTDTLAAFGSSTTKADVKIAYKNQMALLSDACRQGQNALRWCQFLQNSGRISTPDMATLLSTIGFDASRADVADPEYGVDPFAGASVIASITANSRLSSMIAGWGSCRGRYNRAAWGAHGGLSTPAARDSYSGSPLQKSLEFAANHADGIITYIHQIVPYDGTQPDANNVGTMFWRDFLADIDQKVTSGLLVVLSPTEIEDLTYWRADGVFMRWDGEWVLSRDQTKIAL